MVRPEKSKHISWPKPKKIDPYYSNMIDIYKKKVEQLQQKIRGIEQLKEHYKSIGFNDTAERIEQALKNK